MNPHYTDYASYLSRYFDGKVQKLTVNAGFTCPNRDGTKGTGGCIYCNNASFSPMAANAHMSVNRQLEEGKKFFGRKYPAMKYLAYFQSYTNTYGDTEHLRELFAEALSVSDIVGLIIGTRPDMLPDSVIQMLSELTREHYVMVELGVETCHDDTLRRINRNHTWADVTDALQRLHRANIHTGIHLIMGLPGESRPMMMETVRRVVDLPVEVLKFHQLQVLRDTPLAHQSDSIDVFSPEEYMELCADIVEIVPRHIAIERFTSSAPANLLIKPRWGLKNYEFTNLLNNYLDDRNLDTVH